MELAWSVVAVVVLCNAVLLCLYHTLLSAERASCTDAWRLYTDMAERRTALVVENTELQRRLETIEDALGRDLSPTSDISLLTTEQP